jgi:hypothetical protein
MLQMRMDELGSLDLFAKFLLSLVITVAAAIVCSLMIALRVETGEHVTCYLNVFIRMIHITFNVSCACFTNLLCPSAGVEVLVQSLTLSELGVARVAYSEQVRLNKSTHPRKLRKSAACLPISEDPTSGGVVQTD